MRGGSDLPSLSTSINVCFEQVELEPFASLVGPTPTLPIGRVIPEAEVAIPPVRPRERQPRKRPLLVLLPLLSRLKNWRPTVAKPRIFADRSNAVTRWSLPPVFLERHPINAGAFASAAAHRNRGALNEPLIIDGDDNVQWDAHELSDSTFQC